MIGIIPAAGRAIRLHGLPKMMLPICGAETLLTRLIDQMNEVSGLISIGTRSQYIDLFQGYSGNLEPVRWVDVGATDTMSETVLRTRFETIVDQNVMFGMPDTYIEDDQVFVKLARALDDGADVAVGVFRAREGQHTEGGMVVLNETFEIGTFDGERFGNNWSHPVTSIADKPSERISDWIWGCLAWKPSFWQYIKPEHEHVGFGVQRAVEAGMDVRAVKMDGGFWDCGTPDRYFRLINHLTQGGK